VGQLFTWTCTKKTTSWLVHNYSTFGAQTSHGQTWIPKTHHDLDLREAITFPFIIFSVPGHRACLHPNVILSWDSQVGNLEIPKIGTLVILEAHNFLWKPLIEVMSKAKLWPLLRAFQRYVACHLHTSKSRRFLTSSGRESNWQFDSWPFFWP
jgi:hypothetical protein